MILRFDTVEIYSLTHCRVIFFVSLCQQNKRKTLYTFNTFYYGRFD